MKRYFILPIILMLTPVLQAQHRLGFEVQAYPAGIVPGFALDFQLSNQSYINARLAYNFTDRRDWGEHDNEEGGGPGFSIGYKRAGFLSDRLILNLRSDLWLITIDWEETTVVCPFVGPCFDENIDGKTKVTVLQPTLGLSYDLLRTELVLLQSSLMFGYEINIHTKGEEVGQGAILLGGINIAYRF